MPYSGKLVIINCANPSCGCKSKIQVPSYSPISQSYKNVENEIAPTEIPFAQNRSVHFVKLKVLENLKTEEQAFILKLKEQTVGRLSQIPGDYRPNIQITTKDKKISKNHFQIVQFKNTLGDTEVILKDEQSTNGTFLNGSTIPLSHAEEVYLSNGDRIRIGDTLIVIEMF
jgi:pSer/pThr/pTyr-binding forkhead associated (FHA) protein